MYNGSSTVSFVKVQNEKLLIMDYAHDKQFHVLDHGSILIMDLFVMDYENYLFIY